MKTSPQGNGLHSALQALADTVNQAPEPLALDLLLSEDERRPAVDPLDELVEEIRRAEFEAKGSQP